MFYVKELDSTILRFFQQVFNYINLYINSFKSYKQKLGETKNINPIMCIVIKMADSTK